jgi:ABC-type Fe3+-hydroxamate transport system substrate-binding protein
MPTTFTDQMQRPVHLAGPPRRIVSLVPSQTELLHALGLEEEVVGITKFCVHPEAWFRSKARMGGTKDVKLDKVHALQPDLIIGNQEENEQEQIEALAQHYPVWISSIYTLADALEMIREVGRLTGREMPAAQLAAEIGNRFRALKGQLAGQPPIRAAYLIWRGPYMAAGGHTFINSMMQWAGLENIFARRQRYPEISLEELADLRPEAILLSSEPYPFKDKHLEEFRQACPHSAIQLADGELFSWYGSRLLRSADYFLELRRELERG